MKSDSSLVAKFILRDSCQATQIKKSYKLKIHIVHGAYQILQEKKPSSNFV